jgi:ketosteroid isomerase-like protein
MRKYLLTTVLLLALSSIVTAQSNPTNKQRLVQKTVVDLFQALADRDVDKLKVHCTEDVLILESGAVWNIDSLVQRVSRNKGATDFKRVNTFEFIDTKFEGKVAWTTYLNQADITRNGMTRVVRWLETAVLTKEGDQWKVKTLHSSLLKEN